MTMGCCRISRRELSILRAARESDAAGETPSANARRKSALLKLQRAAFKRFKLRVYAGEVTTEKTYGAHLIRDRNPDARALVPGHRNEWPTPQGVAKALRKLVAGDPDGDALKAAMASRRARKN